MKRIAIGIAAAATVLAVAACNANPEQPSGSGGQTAAATKGGTLTILSSSDELDFDPATSQSLAITSNGLVNRRLTAWQNGPGKPATVVSDLAADTGKATDGGKTWTFKLKDGLKFDDGTPITSAAIKYGVERSFAPELSGGLGYHKSLLVGGDSYKGPYSGKELDSIETPDDQTIVFKLKVPYGDWPWIVSMPAFAPVEKSKDTKPADYGKKPASSGPYKVESYRQGVQMILVRNKQWQQSTDTVRTGGPDKIIYKLGQDDTVAAQALIGDSGDAKTSFGSDFVPAAQLAQAQNNPQVKDRLVTSQPGAVNFVALNTQHGALKDVKVRRALQYAIDRKAFIAASGGAISGTPAHTLITPGIEGRQEYDLYPAGDSGDVAKAKQLLKAAGHASDLSLTLVTSNTSMSSAQAQAVEQGLERAGVKVKIQSLDSNAVSEKVTQGKGDDYDMYLGSWQPDFPSPNANIQPLYDSSQIGNGGYNTSRYDNPAVDTLIDKATGEVDQAKAQQQWAAIDKKIMGDAPVIPISYAKNSFLRGSQVQNFFIGSFPAYPNYLKVTLKQG
ncbi:ABC transporter substrate-binding protein [Microlunatus soli]|uniref:Peptide/nickel transport system substrate-binding protein n=1 Tax=Microlunatus soli TaxID=630515 RepID=A0A1H1VP52_9ACTN|nr:ABC transporter substrate-binding protein [Microlunatus soli]SDS86046.1 peptide/nickel transport system substrate-binding protein [Microlunatus soli]